MGLCVENYSIIFTFILTCYCGIKTERTNLLKRKKVNNGMKKINSLPFSPAVLKRPYCREKRYFQVLRTTLAQYSHLHVFFTLLRTLRKK